MHLDSTQQSIKLLRQIMYNILTVVRGMFSIIFYLNLIELVKCIIDN